MDDVKRLFRRSKGPQDETTTPPRQRSRSRSRFSRRKRRSSPSAGIRTSLYNDVQEGDAPEHGSSPLHGTHSEERSYSSRGTSMSHSHPNGNTYDQAGIWTPSSSLGRSQRQNDASSGISNVSDGSFGYNGRNDPSAPPVPRIPDSIDGRDDNMINRRPVSGSPSTSRRQHTPDQYQTTQANFHDQSSTLPPKVNNRYSQFIPRVSRKPVANESPHSKRRSMNLSMPKNPAPEEIDYRNPAVLRSGVLPPPTSPAAGLTGPFANNDKQTRQSTQPPPTISHHQQQQQRPRTPTLNMAPQEHSTAGSSPSSWRSPSSSAIGRSPGPSIQDSFTNPPYHHRPDPSISTTDSRPHSYTSSSLESDGILPHRSTSTSYIPSSATGPIKSGRQTIYKTPTLISNSPHPPDLSTVLNVGTSTHTTQHTHWAPPVFHETVKPRVHHIREERIEREIHNDAVHHRVLPIVDIQVLPAKHYVPAGVDGASLVEVPASAVPGRTADKVNWVIAETVSKLNIAEEAPKERRQFTARKFEGTDGDERSYVSKDGVPTTETTWVHPPTVERGAELTGQTLPLVLDEPRGQQQQQQQQQERRGKGVDREQIVAERKKRDLAGHFDRNGRGAAGVQWHGLNGETAGYPTEQHALQHQAQPGLDPRVDGPMRADRAAQQMNGEQVVGYNGAATGRNW